MAVKRVPGSIHRISIGDGWFAFCQILEDPEIAIFDLITKDETEVAKVASAPLLWRLWVMRRAISSGRWVKVGKATIRAEFLVQVPRFKRDPISKEFSLCLGSRETAASPEECISFESAAVWDPEQVEDRLRDQVNGFENKWVKSLRSGLPT